MQHYAYSSFGKIVKISDGSGNEVTSNPPVKTSYGFTNREHDSESGMMYYRARYMIPEIGRFIQEDPHPGDLRNPITAINKYVYAGNNPVMNVDPDGEFFFTAMLIGAVIGGIAAEASGGNFIDGAFMGAVAGAAIYAGAVVGATASASASFHATAYLGTGFWGSIGTSIASYGAGVLAGGTVGAATGALVGGSFNVLSGRGSFKDGFNQGGGIGYAAGSLGGAYGAYSFNQGYTNLGLAEGSGFGKFLSSKAGLTTVVTTGAYIPLGVYKVEVSLE